MADTAALSFDLFHGDKVRLTAFTDQDYPIIAQWHQNAEFLRLFDGRPAYPRTAQQTQDHIETMQQSPTDFVFAIRPLKDDACVGYLELDGINWTHRITGMGLAIGDRSNRGKGYGIDAARLALRYAFNELNLYRVTVTVFSYNTTSLNLCDKLGFTREGAFREFLQRDGQRFDMILLGILHHEWQARHK